MRDVGTSLARPFSSGSEAETACSADKRDAACPLSLPLEGKVSSGCETDEVLLQLRKHGSVVGAVTPHPSSGLRETPDAASPLQGRLFYNVHG